MLVAEYEAGFGGIVCYIISYQFQRESSWTPVDLADSSKDVDKDDKAYLMHQEWNTTRRPENTWFSPIIRSSLLRSFPMPFCLPPFDLDLLNGKAGQMVCWIRAGRPPILDDVHLNEALQRWKTWNKGKNQKFEETPRQWNVTFKLT